MEQPTTEESANKNSGDDNSSTGSIENITVSVPTEQGTSVELCLKVFGLKPKSAPSRWLHRLGKPENPECLVSNAHVRQWQLSANSFKVVMNVKTDRKAARKHKQRRSDANKDVTTAAASTSAADEELPPGWERFHLHIHRFPSEIIPEHCSFNVVEPSGRNYSFILMEIKKKDNSCSWQQYVRENGTLDVGGS